MKIGDVQVHGRVVLAPMAEYGNLPFRLLAKEFGAALVYTEMAMAREVARRDRRELRLLRTKPAERPVAAQLCGREAAELAEAARVVESLGFDIVDLNVSCPIARILKQGAGGALMAEPEAVGRLVAAMAAAMRLPVTVKIRSGAEAGHINAVEISRVCEGAGAAAIALHPRTVAEPFGGEADWPLIAQVKQAVRIPVIGSGDIRTPQRVREMLHATGCDAVMAARGCLGRPWFFREANHLLNTGRPLPPPSAAQIKQIMLRHFKLLKEHAGESQAALLLRRHLPYYARAMGREGDFGKAVRNVRTAREFEEAVREYL
jgi:nifR3 family TIM-barrel protein